MSKIQINELNLNTSEFNTLNQEETAEVVGGYYYYPGYSYYSYYSSDNDYAVVNQLNVNGTQQAALGGYYGNTGNSNTTYQGNSADISQ